jgi:hypothetical protein
MKGKTDRSLQGRLHTPENKGARPHPVFSAIVVALIPLLLSACGGGGGSAAQGTPSLVYNGNTQAARVNNESAAVLANHLLTGTQLSSSINALKPANDSSARPSNQLTLALLIRDKIHSAAFIPTGRSQQSRPIAARPIDEMEACTTSGSLHVVGDINDSGTGQLGLTFNNCLEGQDLLNGEIIVDVQSFDTFFLELLRFGLAFNNLRLTSGDVALTASGSIQVDRNPDKGTELLTINMLTRDDNSGLMVRLQNTRISISPHLANLTGSFELALQVTFSGRLYHSELGYIDFTTPQAFEYSSPFMPFPDNGGIILMTGAENSRARLIAASADKLRVEIGEQGQDEADDYRVYFWTDIGGEQAPNEAPQLAGTLLISPPSPRTIDNLNVMLAAVTDPDGDPITTSVTWTKNGIAIAGETNNELPSAQHAKGDLIAVEVVLSDGKNSTSLAAQTRILNSPPLVLAGDDMLHVFGTPFQLQGQATDADGDPLTINWSVDAQPFSANTQIDLPLQLNPQVSYSEQGEFVLMLEVSDGEVSSRDFVSVNVEPMDLFQPMVSIPIVSSTEAVSIGDINNDGLQDVVVSNSFSLEPDSSSRIWVLLQDGAGNLSAPVKYDTGLGDSQYQIRSIAIADMNNDGLQDVVSSTFDGVNVMLQNDQGTLEAPVTYASNHLSFTNSYKIATGDFNNDGRTDAASIDWGTQSEDVDIYLQNLDGLLNAPQSHVVAHGGWDDLTTGDINGDGREDIIVMSGQGVAEQVGTLLQGDNGSFSRVGYALQIDTSGGAGIASGDLNNDGRDDVVIAYGGNRPTSNIAVLYQNSAGTLDTPSILPAYDIPGAAQIADINGDSLPDVIISHDGWLAISVFLQKPDGSLLEQQRYPFVYSQSNPHRLAIGDINADGKNDVVEADGGGISILYGR